MRNNAVIKAALTCVLLLTFILLSPGTTMSVAFENPGEPGAYSEDEIEDGAIIDIAPSYILLASERVVNSFGELYDALTKNNGITTVYFGNDITIEQYGIAIHPSKTNVVVDGYNPLNPSQTQPYTLTDYSSALFADTIHINAEGPKTLHVRDLIITGKNYFGPFSVAPAIDDVVLTFERVDYNGPQIGYHRNGTVRFIDCNVSIHGRNGGSLNQEFSEVKHLLFEGTNSINTVSNVNTVFWHPYGGTFRLANDSSLTLTSPNTSAAYGVFFADTYTYKIDIDIGERASFVASITGVVAPTLYSTISSLNVREGGTFRLTASSTVAEPLLLMGGSLTVGKDAAFYINANLSYPVISQNIGDITIHKDATFHLTASGSCPRLINLFGRALICNDPSSVLLYNANRDIGAATTAGRVYVNAEQINYWNAVSGGGLDAPPLHRWTKADGSNFWIDGTLSIGATGNFSALSSNYMAGDPGVQPSATTFSMVNARVLAFGRLELIVTPPTAGTTSVSGVTAPGATVRVTFSQNGTDYTLPDVIADAEGVFHVQTGVPLENQTVVTVKGNHQYLTATATATVAGQGALSITVPYRMEFHTTELSITDTFAKRLNPDWHIAVSDTRGAGGEWSVYARLLQPLTPSDISKPVLSDALVFIDSSAVPLASDMLLIHHHASATNDELTLIHWAAERGVLIQVPVNIAYSGINYTAIIEWTLVDAP